ncbi:MAG: hypothetical protein M1828_005940 [Chrysothrix sp. TS-e1954]|nr:MAG: hypothetical protein M1828_005940 [Chrysothrix sp. TS-e1954]
MASCTVLITGGNTGLGYATVQALLASPQKYDILLGGRSLDKVASAIDALKQEFVNTPSTLSALQVDVSDDASIQKAFDTVSSKPARLDVLINNAGHSLDFGHAQGKLSMRQAWTKAYDTNVSGTQIMTHTFMPLLIKSSNPRLLFITSGTSSLVQAADGAQFAATSVPAGWPKPPGVAFPAYRSSKTGMNMMMLEWKRTLMQDHVKLWCICPGFLATGLGLGNPEAVKKMGAGDPSLGANLIRDVVEGKRDTDVGKIVTATGIQPW